jgi:hypothetical protein
MGNFETKSARVSFYLSILVPDLVRIRPRTHKRRESRGRDRGGDGGDGGGGGGVNSSPRKGGR